MQSVRSEVGDASHLRHLLDFKRSAMDPILDHHQRGHGILRGVSGVGQLDIHDLHDHLHPPYLPSLMDSR